MVLKILNLNMINERNGNWKGELIDRQKELGGIHSWIYRRKIKPLNCECCGKEKRLDLANISQEYKRDINDYEWLCRYCHMKKDGRLEKFNNFNEKRKNRITKKCLNCGEDVTSKISKSSKFCNQKCYDNYRIGKPRKRGYIYE